MIELSARDARRLAVTAQLLARPRPRTIPEVAVGLRAVQMDLTQHVAPNAELVFWSRLGRGLSSGALDDALRARHLIEVFGFLRPAEDVSLYAVDMAGWPGPNPSKYDAGLARWVEANDGARRQVLDQLAGAGALTAVRMKIIQQLGGRSMTTTQLREALPEVKQATLYRHVAALLEADILAVIGERHVRGATERTLALGDRMAHVGHGELQAMDAVQLRSAFTVFLSGLSNDFERLLDDDRTDLRGSLGFARAVLHLDTQDLEKLQAEIMDVLTPYLEKRKEGQRRIALATVLIPETDD